MGDNYLRQQAANTKVQRDAATAEIEEPQLYERPEIVETIFSIQPDEGKSLQVGEMLLVQPGSDRTLVASRGHARVGVVSGEGAAVLYETLAAGGHAIVLMVQVIEVMEVSGVGHARVVAQRN